MKERQFEPEESNIQSPAPGLASVNTHNPKEPLLKDDQTGQGRINSGTQEQEAEDQETKAAED